MFNEMVAVLSSAKSKAQRKGDPKEDSTEYSYNSMRRINEEANASKGSIKFSSTKKFNDETQHSARYSSIKKDTEIGEEFEECEEHEGQDKGDHHAQEKVEVAPTTELARHESDKNRA